MMYYVASIISEDLSLLLTRIPAMAILIVDIAVQNGNGPILCYQLGKH
jgi:hypothetical protein